MKLNVYKKKEIVKTYEVDTYDLMWGTIEDVAAAIDLDKLETGSDVEIIKLVGKLIFTSMDTISNLLKDIFDGLTDEELRNTKTAEIAVVLIDVVKFTIAQLNIGFKGNKGKN